MLCTLIRLSEHQELIAIDFKFENYLYFSMAVERGKRSKKTTIISFEIIEALIKMEGATVSQLAQELDIAPSTAQEHLSTLKELEYVTQDGGIYFICFKFARIGNQLLNQRKYDLATKYTQKVSRCTGYRSIFAIEEHGKAVHVARNPGDYTNWKHEEIGMGFPVHATAAGKVILANYSERKVKEILEKRGLPKLTENTITDKSEFWSELQKIHDEDIAFNLEESKEGVNAVSAPVFNKAGQIVGGLSANGPATQLKGEEFRKDISEKVFGIANEYTLDLKFNK